jgi:hypothetical protein
VVNLMRFISSVRVRLLGKLFTAGSRSTVRKGATCIHTQNAFKAPQFFTEGCRTYR